MIDELLKEIQELKEYKRKYDLAIIEKQRMSDMLYELMTNEYLDKTLAERKAQYSKDMCCNCRSYGYCTKELPENIEEPIKNNKAWIPATRSCKQFEWD